MKVERDLPGGSSRPWIITAQNNSNFEEYVVKLYNNKSREIVPLINKELYASILTQEFDIPTPEPALINFTSEFINTLEGDDRARIEALDSKLAFGCKYYEGFTDYPKPIKPSKVKSLNPETIFAFDVLIRNFDRRFEKPNLIIKGDDYFCIDHEHSLDVRKPFSDYDIFNDWYSLRNPSRCHLFYTYLKQRRSVEFFEFRDYFRTFNTKALEKLGKFLKTTTLAGDDLDETIVYLNDVAQNKDKFFSLLSTLIKK